MPEPSRQKPLRELLHESVNDTAVRVAKSGFAAIDELADRGTAKLDQLGITVRADLKEQLITGLKKIIVRGMSPDRRPDPKREIERS